MDSRLSWTFPARLLRDMIPGQSDTYRLLVLKTYLAVLKCILFDLKAILLRGTHAGIRGRRAKQFEEFLRGSAIWGEYVRKMTATTIIRLNEINPPPSGHLIFLNHTSEMDFAFDCLILRKPFLANQQIKASVFAYWWMKAMGSQVFSSGDRRSIAASTARLKERLEIVSYIVYPEGRNSYSEELQPFKRGMLKSAFEWNVPVYAVVKSGLTGFLKRPTNNTIGYNACGVVSPAECSGCEEFHDRIRSLMLSGKRTLDHALEADGRAHQPESSRGDGAGSLGTLC